MGGIASSLAGLPPFLMYVVVGGLLTVIFAVVYCRLTPHDEFALVREGNLAAAVAFGGNLIGFSIPLDRVIAQASSILDCVIWAAIAAVVQWLVYLLCRFFFPNMSAQITGNNVAVATLLASAAIVAGMLNSASMAL